LVPGVQGLNAVKTADVSSIYKNVGNRVLPGFSYESCSQGWAVTSPVKLYDLVRDALLAEKVLGSDAPGASCLGKYQHLVARYQRVQGLVGSAWPGIGPSISSTSATRRGAICIHIRRIPGTFSFGLPAAAVSVLVNAAAS